MAEVGHHLRTWRQLAAANIRSQLQYRVSFALDLVGAALGPLVDFVAIVFLFQHLPRLDGWSLPEVAFLYATSAVSFALCDLVVGHLDKFNVLINTGGFDQFLVRPLGSLFQVVTAELQLRRLGKVAQGLAVLVYALTAADLHWTATKVVVFATMILTGAVIFICIWVTGAAVCFWTVDTIEVNNALTYGGNFLTAYPLGIFSRWLQRIMAFGFGLAFVNYYPSLYLLDKGDLLGLPSWARFAAPLVAALAVAVCVTVWRSAVRHYRSTGS